jgi:hypothetical protein
MSQEGFEPSNLDFESNVLTIKLLRLQIYILNIYLKTRMMRFELILQI